ncbi:hypothetical protein [Brevundimonas intermedia]|uniref:hypothetical protein n=1 Tax=Brevundimonas intermedia TaxID=74315 RepID=UPI003207A7A5
MIVSQVLLRFLKVFTKVIRAPPPTGPTASNSREREGYAPMKITANKHSIAPQRALRRSSTEDQRKRVIVADGQLEAVADTADQLSTTQRGMGDGWVSIVWSG